MDSDTKYADYHHHKEEVDTPAPIILAKYEPTSLHEVHRPS